MTALESVMSMAEAADRWHLAKVTVRQACSGYKKSPPRFCTDEARRSGSTWVEPRGKNGPLFNFVAEDVPIPTQGDAKTDVLVNYAVQPTCCMEKLYATIEVA